MASRPRGEALAAWGVSPVFDDLKLAKRSIFGVKKGLTLINTYWPVQFIRISVGLKIL